MLRDLSRSQFDQNCDHSLNYIAIVDIFTTTRTIFAKIERHIVRLSVLLILPKLSRNILKFIAKTENENSRFEKQKN